MHAKKIYIALTTIIIITGCSSRTTGDDVFISRNQAGNSIRVNYISNNYAALDSVARKYINQEIDNHPKQAVEFAITVYDTLQNSRQTRKDFALFLFSHREHFKKDSSALKIFFDFFGNRYADDYYVLTYDQQHIGIAEYFIALQKMNNWLNPNHLLYFKETLGIGFHVAGDLKKATSYYQDVLTNDMKNDSAGNYADNICNSVSHICITLLENGLYDSVITYTNFFLKKYPFSKNKQAKLHTIRAESFLYKRDIRNARYSINTVGSLIHQVHNPGDSIKRVYECAEMKSMIQYADGNYRQSLYDIKEALTAGLAYEEQYRNRYIGKTLLQIGSVFKKLNHPDSAAWYTHQALYTVAQVDSADIYSLPAENDVYAENTMMDALDSLALLWDEQYMRTKDTGVLKKALQARTLAFIAEKKLLEAFSYDESMTNMLLASKKRSERALFNCYTLWQTDHSPQWIERAILMNENSKATTLLHSIKKNVVLSQMQEQDSTALELNRNRLYTIMLERELNTNNDNTRKTAIQSTLDSLQKNLLLLENDLKTRLPALSRTGRDDPGTMIRSLKKRLQNDNACLLQYFNTDSGALVLWLDFREQCGMNLVSAAAMNVVDSFLTQGIRSPVLFENNRPEYFRLSASCTNITLPGAVQQAVKERRYKKLLVIPDGSFSVLPFEALTPVNGEYLVKYCSVYNGYSIGTLFANDSIKINTNNIAVFTPYSKKEFTGKNRLAFTQDEANAINHAFGQLNTFDDTAATIKAFRNALNKNRVIHIATHAEAVNGAEPKVFFYDSSLNMSDLYASPTKAELVVLSSCETGIGTLDPNEGPLSLARGFYYAGAKNVVSGLWRIEDSKTAEMFKYFYRHYDRGHTGRLLYDAKLKFLENNPGKYQAPYYWAGLVHTGLDDDAPKKTVSVFRILFILIPLTALLLFWNRFRRKQSAV